MVKKKQLAKSNAALGQQEELADDLAVQILAGLNLEKRRLTLSRGGVEDYKPNTAIMLQSRHWLRDMEIDDTNHPIAIALDTLLVLALKFERDRMDEAINDPAAKIGADGVMYAADSQLLNVIRLRCRDLGVIGPATEDNTVAEESKQRDETRAADQLLAAFRGSGGQAASA